MFINEYITRKHYNYKGHKTRIIDEFIRCGLFLYDDFMCTHIYTYSHKHTHTNIYIKKKIKNER